MEKLPFLSRVEFFGVGFGGKFPLLVFSLMDANVHSSTWKNSLYSQKKSQNKTSPIKIQGFFLFFEGEKLVFLYFQCLDDPRKNQNQGIKEGERIPCSKNNVKTFWIPAEFPWKLEFQPTLDGEKNRECGN